MRVIGRHVRTVVDEARRDTPVVLLVGARQVGKSTLAQATTSGPGAPHPITLDDPARRASATEDPTAFVRGLRTPAIIDEIQRAPELLLAIKMAVDEQRLRGDDAAGMFLLTGSAAIWDTVRAPDSLAGRIEHVRLWPFSQGELEGRREDLVERLYAGDVPRLDGRPVGRAVVAERVVRGGYPEAQGRTAARSDRWFGDYLSSLVDRDVGVLADVRRSPDLLRLLVACAARSGSVTNVSEMLADIGLPRTTGHRYLDLLRRLYLVHELPAWGRNLARASVRSPKLVVTDTGVLCHLLHMDADRFAHDDRLRPGPGPAFETFVTTELLKAITWSRESVRAHHWRDRGGREVDVLLERRDGAIVGVETKLGSTVRPADARHLAHLRDHTGQDFRAGIVVHTGPDTVPLGDRLWGVPVEALWTPE